LRIKSKRLINVYNKEQVIIFLLIAVASFVMQVLLNVHLKHNQIRKVHLNVHRLMASSLFCSMSSGEHLNGLCEFDCVSGEHLKGLASQNWLLLLEGR
jgi:hypothetical protein